MDLSLAILKGDGIGTEIIDASLPILEHVANERGHHVSFNYGCVGWEAYDKYGDTMPESAWELCRNSGAILFGAVGLPDRDPTVVPAMRPERRVLFPLRKEFGLSCNLRPVCVWPGLEDISPLKNGIARGVRILWVRELLGDAYFGGRLQGPPGQEWSEDGCRYTKAQIEEVARFACKIAETTGQQLTSVDKANALGATGTYWRQIVTDLCAYEFPHLLPRLQHVYVDAMNLYMFLRPRDFNGVVLTSNVQGDILTDGAAGIMGGMAMLPSASINPNTGFALYEQAGGSAPTIAGQGIANPIATILSIALLFRYTLQDEEAACAIESAVERTLYDGYRTVDLFRGLTHECRRNTVNMALMIKNRIRF